MWNRVFEECIPVDLRNLDLKVEPMFDEALNIKMRVIIFMKKKQRKFWILGVEQNSFDGVILSNVLDVMPKDISTTVIDDLERVPEDSQQEAGY